MYDDLPEGLRERILSGAGEVARRYARPSPPSQRMLTAKVRRVDRSGTLDLDYEGAELAGVPMTEACHAAKPGDTVLVVSYRAELIATGVLSTGIPDQEPTRTAADSTSLGPGAGWPAPTVLTRTVTVSTSPDGNAGVGLLASDAAIVSATTSALFEECAIACAPYLFDASRGELGIHCTRVNGKNEPAGGQSLTVTVSYMRLR